MRVAFFDGEEIIGISDLVDLDPPMGVAMGAFLPTEFYRMGRHANLIDGDWVADRGADLKVRSLEFGAIECGGVSIHEFSAALGELEVSVLGIPYPQYETYFGENPQFKNYSA